MEASREEAKKADAELWAIAHKLDALGDKLGNRKTTTDPLKIHLLRVQGFVSLMSERLPKESTIRANRTRRGRKK